MASFAEMAKATAPRSFELDTALTAEEAYARLQPHAAEFKMPFALKKGLGGPNISFKKEQETDVIITVSFKGNTVKVTPLIQENKTTVGVGGFDMRVDKNGLANKGFRGVMDLPMQRGAYIDAVTETLKGILSGAAEPAPAAAPVPAAVPAPAAAPVPAAAPTEAPKKFCSNCGAQLNGQSKFCPECGFKVETDTVVPPPVVPPAPPMQVYEPPVVPPAPPVQEAPPVQTYTPPVQEAPPVQTYTPPVQEAPPVQTYTPPVQEAPPVQTYTPPVQEAPPVQTYTPPVQEAPPVQTYTPPVQEAPPVQTYTPPVQEAPPVQTYTPPAQPAAKSGKKSSLPLFIGIGVAVLVVILAIIFIPKLFGGDANLGKYECVSMNMMGFEITGSDLAEMGESWIELRSGGKCTLMLMDEKVTGTWELDGEKITCELDGETCKGKLKDGRLELTVESEGVELEIVFEKKDSAKGKGEKETEAPPTPVGRYDIESMTVMEQILEGDALAQMGETWLEIKDDGSCTLMLMGEKLGGTYTLDDGDITCTLEGVECVGTWDEGGVELTMAEEGTELVMVFAKTDSLPAGSTGTAGGYDWWEGDWYGWWIVTDGSGEYEDLIDNYWDACATIDFDGTTGSIAIWDENTSKSELLADVEIEYTDGFGENGAFVSVSGAFMDSNVGYYDWFVDSDGDDASDIEDMICISGTYTDDAGDSFDYYIFLRPWGTEWNDVDGVEFPNAPYDDMMPAGYYSWYLPLIEDGVTKAPDQVG